MKLVALIISMLMLCSFTPFEKEAKESEEGREKYEQGDMEGAGKQFEKVAKRLKKSPQAYFDLGNARLKAGKNEEALDAYRKSLETGKADRSLRSDIYHNMGNTFAQMQKLSDAEKMFVKSLIEEPSKESAENLEIVRRMIKLQEQQKKEQQKKDKEQKEKEDQEKKDEQEQQENNEEKQKQDEQSQDQKQDKKDQPKEDKEQKEQKQAEKKEQQEKKQASAAKKDEKKDDDEKKKGQLLQQFKQRKNLQISPFMLQKESESDSGQTW